MSIAVKCWMAAPLGCFASNSEQASQRIWLVVFHWMCSTALRTTPSFGVPAPTTRTRDKLTDPESHIIKRVGGGYGNCCNAQTAVAEATQIIAAVEVVNSSSDVNQLPTHFDSDGLLSPVEAQEEGRIRSPFALRVHQVGRAAMVALVPGAGLLDLDFLGTPVAQHPAGKEPRQQATEVERASHEKRQRLPSAPLEAGCPLFGK